MSSNFVIQATALIERWEKTVFECRAVQEHEKEFTPEQVALLAGLAFGMEVALEELSEMVAKALQESTRLERSLM